MIHEVSPITPNYPRPTLEMIQSVTQELGKPVDIYEAMTILNLWDNTNPKPHNLTLWLNELLTDTEDTDHDNQ